MIEIKNLTVTYKDTPAIDNINVTLSKSKIIGIVGPNGAGKSTLIKAVLNIIPSKGIIKIDDKLSKDQLGSVAYVEQKINIDYNFPIKVRECVSLGIYPKIGLFKNLNKSDWQKVDEALKLVGLEEFSNRQISELSVSEEIIMNTLRKLRDNGHTILIVHHDLRKVHAYFDEVLLLNKKLISYGNTKETFTRENLTNAYGTDLFFMGGGSND